MVKMLTEADKGHRFVEQSDGTMKFIHDNPEELSGMEPQLGSSHVENVSHSADKYGFYPPVGISDYLFRAVDVITWSAEHLEFMEEFCQSLRLIDDGQSGMEPQLGGIHGQRIQDELISKYYSRGNMSPEEFRQLFDTKWIHNHDENCEDCDHDILNSRINNLSGYGGLLNGPTMVLTSGPHSPEHVEITPMRNEVRRDSDGIPISPCHGRPLTMSRANRILIEHRQNMELQINAVFGLSERMMSSELNRTMTALREAVSGFIEALPDELTDGQLIAEESFQISENDPYIRRNADGQIETIEDIVNNRSVIPAYEPDIESFGARKFREIVRGVLARKQSELFDGQDNEND